MSTPTSPLAAKTALVTGASSGIGRAIAEALGAAGMDLHLVARDAARLGEVAEAIGRAHPGVTTPIHTAELTDDDAVHLLATRVAEAAPQLDVLVHAAGVARLGRTRDARLADLDHTWAVNVRAVYALTQALLPAVCAARGQVVLVNSGAGLNARAGWGTYAMSKFALRAFGDALREELKPDGVRVIALYPGRTASPMQADVHAQEGKVYEPARFIQPEHLATLLVTALSMPPGTQVHELNVRHAD
jgi:NADP-dependent 3-hydroxy acid dehydrogenase YdfG